MKAEGGLTLEQSLYIATDIGPSIGCWCFFG
jgi:hypothetical protein